MTRALDRGGDPKTSCQVGDAGCGSHSINSWQGVSNRARWAGCAAEARQTCLRRRRFARFRYKYLVGDDGEPIALEQSQAVGLATTPCVNMFGVCPAMSR